MTKSDKVSFIDKIANKANIIRLNDIETVLSLTKWQCTKCNHKWEIPARSLIRSPKCPNCFLFSKYDNYYIDEKLIGRNILRVENSSGVKIPINWKCLNEECLHIWKSTPDSVILGGSGCPLCAGKYKLTNDIFDKKIANKSIIRIGNIINRQEQVLCKCLICKVEWMVLPSNMMRKEIGCANCSNRAKLSNKDIDLKLIGRNIKRIDNIKNVSTPIYWKCLISSCGYVWSATPDCVLNKRKSGCPVCNIPGMNEKLLFNNLLNSNIEFVFQQNLGKISNDGYKNRFDFYIPNLNLAIEYNGKQHYMITGFSSDHEKNSKSFEDQKRRDEFKRKFCVDKNIELIEIDGREFHSSKLDEAINSILIPYIKDKLCQKVPK